VFNVKTGLAALAGAAAYGAVIKRTLQWADSIAKTADALQVTTKTLQEYQFVAQQTGVDQKLLNSGFLAFGKRLAELQETAKGPLATYLKVANKGLFDQLRGVKNVSEGLKVYFAAMANAREGTERLGLANAGFSRANLKMVNMVKHGSETMKELVLQANKYGLILKDNVIRQSERTIDAFAILSGVIRTSFAEALVKTNGQLERFALWAANNKQTISDFFDTIIKGAELAIRAVAALGRTVRSIDNAFGISDRGKKIAARNNMLMISVGIQRKANEEYNKGRISLKEFGQRMSWVSAIRAKYIKLNKEEIETQEKVIKGIKGDQTRTIKKLPSDDAEAKRKADKLRADTERLRQSLLTERQLLDEQTTDRILKIDELWEKEKITVQTRNEWKLIVEKNYQKKLTDLSKKSTDERVRYEAMSLSGKAKFITGKLAEITAQGAQHNKKLFKINKAASAANALVSTYQGAAKALEWGWPLGPIFAALITANGLAQVKAINSQSFNGGGAGGGSLPGSSVPQIPDTVANQGSEAPERSKTVRINLGDDDDLVSKGAVRRLIDRINEEIGDGHRILTD